MWQKLEVHCSKLSDHLGLFGGPNNGGNVFFPKGGVKKKPTTPQIGQKSPISYGTTEISKNQF